MSLSQALLEQCVFLHIGSFLAMPCNTSWSHSISSLSPSCTTLHSLIAFHMSTVHFPADRIRFQPSKKNRFNVSAMSLSGRRRAASGVSNNSPTTVVAQHNLHLVVWCQAHAPIAMPHRLLRQQAFAAHLVRVAPPMSRPTPSPLRVDLVSM